MLHEEFHFSDLNRKIQIIDLIAGLPPCTYLSIMSTDGIATAELVLSVYSNFRVRLHNRNYIMRLIAILRFSGAQHSVLADSFF